MNPRNTRTRPAPTTSAPARPPASRVDERDVAVGGRRIHLRDVGEPADPPLLFLHGIMGHRRDWDVLVDRVATRHRVIAVDQRGHGRSDRAAGYRVADMADDAVAVIEQLGIAPVTIVGHSMGAMVAFIVAARRPDLVDRLVAIDLVPASLEAEPVHQMPEVFAAMARASYASVDDAVTEWQAANPLARPDLVRNYVAHALVAGPDGRLRWGFDALGLRSFFDGVTPDELWAAIDAVRCPSLVVRGERSPVVTSDQAIELSERLGGAGLVTIAGGGHDLGVEQPEAVADAVLAFLSATPR